MMLLGSLVNMLAIFAGCFVGVTLGRFIPERFNSAIEKGIALCVFYIGLDGVLAGSDTLVAILSMVLGVILGELLDLDGRIHALGDWVERRFAKKQSKTSISEGFVNASLLFCVGAMAIMGALDSGLTGDHATLYAKSTLDGITSIVYGSTMGAGVALSGVAVFLYQGLITLCASFIAPFLSDVVIAEIGGTVGDIESQPYLEAIRQVAAEQGRENVLFIHVPLIVAIPGSGELKSKPTQHSVKELLSVGIQPDVLVCRTDSPLPQDVRDKIALFCNVEKDCVIPNLTASTLYEVPLLLEREGLCRVVCRKLGLGGGQPDMAHWREMVERIHQAAQRHVTIALVGKYTELHDAYLSVVEALFHAGTACGAQVDIRWVDSSELTADNTAEKLAGCAGILVPGGFGDRGIEGMILASQYAREQGVPYFGICLGMQIAVIEFARHGAGWADAHSAEFSDTTAHPVIDLMPDQVGVTAKGGTMRLGKYPCALAEGSRARSAYGEPLIWERHRHRYECNNDFRPALEAAGLRVAGTSPDGRLVEVVELPEHPWYVGCQFHPEFKSRPDRPHPLFTGFVAAALERK